MNEYHTEQAPAYPISSVENALKLLNLFSRQNVVRIVDASRELGVARSTAHRLVQMLQRFGLVAQDPTTRGYSAGPELMRMALAVVGNLTIRTVARPAIQSLVARIDETVNLAERVDASVIFIDSVEAQRSLRVSSRAGLRLPAHSTASGKVLLADLSVPALHALYPCDELERVTHLTIDSLRRLEAELVRVRANGFASNFGESESEVHSIAVPVRDPHGVTRAALAVSVPPTRLSAERVPEVAAELTRTAAEIGALIPA